MFEKQDKETNDGAIEKFREAFIFEAAWELESELEFTSTKSEAKRSVKAATVIFNKALNRTENAVRIDLWVSMEDVEQKRKEVWGRKGVLPYIADDSEVLQN